MSDPDDPVKLRVGLVGYVEADRILGHVRAR
jgi:hypothetical protein